MTHISNTARAEACHSQASARAAKQARPKAALAGTNYVFSDLPHYHYTLLLLSEQHGKRYSAATKFNTAFMVIGASVSEPHTSGFNTHFLCIPYRMLFIGHRNLTDTKN